MVAGNVSDGVDRLAGRAKFARGLLMAFVVIAGLGIASLLYLLLITLGLITFSSMVAAVGLVTLVGVITFIAAAIVILMWLFLARSNLVAAGLEELRYSPGWSVGSFFVPLVNLVVPMQSMRELHNRSHGEIPELGDASVPAVQSWWACHLAGSFLILWQTFTGLVNSLTNLYFVTPAPVSLGVQIFGMLAMAGSAWFLRKIIGQVTEAQQSLLNISRTFG